MRVFQLNLVFLCLFSLPTFLKAQTWSRSYGESADSTYFFNHIMRTSDGGLLLSGSVAKAAESNLYIVKTDKNGIKQWEKTFANIKMPMTPKGVMSNSSGFTIMGNMRQGAGDSALIFFLKLDASGNATSLKTYGVSNLRNWFNHAIVTKDNQILAFTHELQLAGNPIKQHVKVYKLTVAGDTLWTRAYYNFMSSQGLGRSFVQTSDNGFLLPIDSISGIIGGGISLQNSFMKIAENGDFQWSRQRLGVVDNLYPIGNNLYAGGSLGQAYVFNEQGVAVWSRPVLFINLPAGSANGGLTLMSSDNNIINISTLNYSNGTKGLGVVKSNLQGGLMWAQNLPITDPNLYYYVSHGISQATDTCFLVAGRVSNQSNNSNKAWLAQIGACATSTKEARNNLLTINVLQNPLVSQSLIQVQNTPLSNNVFAYIETYIIYLYIVVSCCYSSCFWLCIYFIKHIYSS